MDVLVGVQGCPTSSVTVFLIELWWAWTVGFRLRLARECLHLPIQAVCRRNQAHSRGRASDGSQYSYGQPLPTGAEYLPAVCAVASCCSSFLPRLS